MLKWFKRDRNNDIKTDQGLSTEDVMIMPSMDAAEDEDDAFDVLSEYEKPGYRMCSFVQDFVETIIGPVPQVKTYMNGKDYLSTFIVRLGIRRDKYRVSPGLYCVGTPDENSEVLVTANFKLTFDHLRQELGSINAWILVLDTKGINVWCAAGKGTFSTKELVRRINKVSLEKLVSHKRLIVPQLGATGVSARKVREASGFRVIYGPIRAKDISRFLENDRKADREMRQVTFTLFERFILTPIEVKIIIRPVTFTALILFIISGFGTGFFSLTDAWSRGLMTLGFLLAGIISGAVITPTFLPFIPFKAFAAKGIISGAIFAGLTTQMISTATISLSALTALSLFTVVVSSYLAMNFTGATPFTSPSGVEKEMKMFIPVQAVGLVVSAGLWIYSAL